MLRIYRLCLPTLMLLSADLWSAPSPMQEPHQSINPNVEEYVWKETETELPPYPREENLLPFQVDLPGARFDYYIDTQSISITPADGIVRYSLVIRSKSGSSNVSFEGMRCTTGEYKVYAYGDGRGAFRPLRKPRWQPIGDQGHARYRYELWEYYLCPLKMLAVSREKIINNIKYYKPDIEDRGFR